MKHVIQTKFLTLVALIVLSGAVFSHENEIEKETKSTMFSGLETPAGKAVLAFHKALETGDVKTARSLLADNVLILEGKSVERSAQEYANHHMLSDIKYLRAMSIESIEHHVVQYDVVATSISRSRVKGTYKDKNVDRIGNETITLRRQDDNWKITHIHWSN
nr:nuclear transport factor 2 family protein [uncultured Glaciecola sp.]